MSPEPPSGGRVVPPVHARRSQGPDPSFEADLAASLRATFGVDGLNELYGRFRNGTGLFDTMMRRVVVKAGARRVGDGVHVAEGVSFRHLDTMTFGDGVFIGEQACVHGRFDGTCEIGAAVWIGPQVYLDARHLVIDDYAGIGPGARVIGSTHDGVPVDVPIIQTPLRIEPVHIGAWSDVGANAVILPGVTIGKGALVGAGAVVREDVPPFAVVAGVPARFLRWREGYRPEAQ